ncbi:MAG: hypothetical protein ACJ74W_06875 [Pyrinomonadaceae bacterium]
MKFMSKLVLQGAAVLALAAALPPLCAGQSNSNGPRGLRSDPTSRELQRQLEHDLLLKELQEMAAHRRATRSNSGLGFAQISEDFMRLQVADNGLAQAVATGGALDLKFVAQSVAEIKKRAARLKTNLALPEPAPNVQRPMAVVGAEPGQLKAALATLDELVLSFVSNPGFQNASVVDAESAGKARLDLEAIIELSGRVKKSSEQLQKTAQTSRCAGARLCL